MTPADGIARDAAAIDAATNDREVENAIQQLPPAFANSFWRFYFRFRLNHNQIRKQIEMEPSEFHLPPGRPSAKAHARHRAVIIEKPGAAAPPAGSGAPDKRRSSRTRARTGIIQRREFQLR